MCSWLVISLVTIRISRSFSAELLLSTYWWMGLLLPSYRIFLFPLTERLEVLLCHFSSMSRPVWVVAQAPGTSATPHSFVSFTNLMSVCTVPPSRSLIEMLIGVGQLTDPWGTALETCLQVDFCHSSQLPGPSHSQSPSLSIYPTPTSLACLLEVVLTALLKPN